MKTFQILLFHTLLAVAHGNRTVALQWYGYSLCEFCFESANVVGNALAIDGLNELVYKNINFKTPVHHLNLKYL